MAETVKPEIGQPSVNMTTGSKGDTLKVSSIIAGVGVVVGSVIVLKLADALIKKI